MDNVQAKSSLWEEVTVDSVRCWQQLPNKTFFFALLAAWLLLFQFYGNATFGYIAHSASLMYWMWFTYNNPMSHGEDGHGNLIPFVVLALFWWKRKELVSLPNRVWWPAILMLAMAAVLHVIGYMVQQPRISIVALFAGIYALMGLAWGPQWLRSSFFPFFLFVFCIPITSIGEWFTFPLRVIVTKIVAGFSNTILGIDVVRQGTQLINASHHYQYEVAAACSGLQSLIAIFALATIYAFLFIEKPWKKAAMIASALPLAMLGNVIRMLVIIIAAEMNGQEGGKYVHDSAIFSMIPYIPAFIGVVFLGRWLQERPAELSIPAEAKPA
jgi:exosortase